MMTTLRKPAGQVVACGGEGVTRRQGQRWTLARYFDKSTSVLRATAGGVGSSESEELCEFVNGLFTLMLTAVMLELSNSMTLRGAEQHAASSAAPAATCPCCPPRRVA